MSAILKKSKARVMNGTIAKTSGGLEKSDIKVITRKDGSKRYVSKKKSALAKKSGAASASGPLGKWRAAVKAAEKKLCRTTHNVAPSNKAGSKSYDPELYKAAKKLYKC